MQDVTHVDWQGYDACRFDVDGRESFLVCPHQAALGNPWVWRAEFFGAFDAADRALLAQGWHLAYHKASDMYGCTQAVAYFSAFQDVVEQRFGLSPTPVLFGFSRGGLYAFQYACAHPQRVSALYLDAPVLDIRSWPGAQGASSGYDETCWRDCLRWYGLDEQSVLHFHQNPLDKAGQLAAQGVPILLIAGLMDKVVPFMENGAILQARYLQAGGDIQVITKDHCDHHPHSLEDPTPIVQWVQTHQRPMHPTLEAKEWTNLWYEEAADHTKPRILLVGDSISNGYCHAVNDVLAGRAYANSFATSMALDHPGFLPALDAAWGQNGYTYDLVHFNNGLHGWHLSDASYGAHYERVVRHIRTQYPATRIVLVLSTPVCLPGPDMILDPEKDDAVQSRNRIVQEIARRYQLPVNDLYHAMLGRNDDRTTDGYHYQASGVAYQGAHVAQYLLAQLSR